MRVSGPFIRNGFAGFITEVDGRFNFEGVTATFVKRGVWSFGDEVLATGTPVDTPEAARAQIKAYLLTK